MAIILSYLQAEPLLTAWKNHQIKARTSLDLNLTNNEVVIGKNDVTFPDGDKISIKDLKKIYKHQNRCYFVSQGMIQPIVIYSEKTGWVRTLYPTHCAPTTLVSGILMHRIKDTDPWKDTQSKIKALGKLREAVVLDTATGLGYTAIQAAKEAKEVTTIELDPAALEVATYNPWSKPLFDSPNICRITGSLLDEIPQFESLKFTHIIHDPPTFKLAGELYSGSLYREFYRILRPNGKLFHYIGNPESEHGAQVTKGVVIRLREAGFGTITDIPEAFGVLAQKEA